MVIEAAKDSSAPAEDALEKLCRAYWYPLYVYVRRRGYAPHDAQDLTQSFFERLLGKKYLSGVDRNKGNSAHSCWRHSNIFWRTIGGAARHKSEAAA